MNSFTIIFLIALGLSSAIEYWLTSRQIRYVRDHRHEVPEDFKDTVTLENHQKAADYTVDKAKVANIDRIVSLVILLSLTLGGGIEAIQNFWTSLNLSPIALGCSLIFSVMLLTQLLELPLSIYQTFVVEERYGFNRNTPAQFVKDLILQTILMLALGGALLSLILWVMGSVGQYWWVLAIIQQVFPARRGRPQRTDRIITRPLRIQKQGHLCHGWIPSIGSWQCLLHWDGQ
jgi:STE24 endopeptidase